MQNNLPEGVDFSQYLDYNETELIDPLNELERDPFDEFDIDPIEVDGEGEEVFE